MLTVRLRKLMLRKAMISCRLAHEDKVGNAYPDIRGSATCSRVAGMLAAETHEFLFDSNSNICHIYYIANIFAVEMCMNLKLTFKLATFKCNYT